MTGQAFAAARPPTAARGTPSGGCAGRSRPRLRRRRWPRPAPRSTSTATSKHAPDPLGHAVLTVVVCLSFVGTGLVALRRRPYVRFGLLLAAVGFASLLGALHDANGAVPYTIGVLAANLVFAVLVHALSRFRTAGSHRGANRLSSLVAYVDVLVLQARRRALRPADAVAQRPPAQRSP